MTLIKFSKMKEAARANVMNNSKKMKIPRFVAGKLVMLSRKEAKSGAHLPYYADDAEATEQKHSERLSKTRSTAPVGQLERGVPILLIEDPKMVPEFVQQQRNWFGSRFELQKQHDKGTDKNRSWMIRFILDEKIYRMYLTKYQYNNELVRAVPKRLKKDYGTNF